jgi:hypothetical protein
MKKTLFILMIAVSFPAALRAAEEQTLKSAPYVSLKDQAFIVETTEEDADESLNRISGDIDLGFIAPSSSYDSANHTGFSPFGGRVSNAYDPQNT